MTIRPLHTLRTRYSRVRVYARVILWLVALAIVSAKFVDAANPIQTENAKSGTTDWQLSNPATNHEIEGYASLTSVNRGGEISLFVNTSESTYTIEMFRMGWYGGTGGRRLTSAIQLTGTPQTIPTPDPVTGLIECNWSTPYVLSIPINPTDPSDWASGVYLAKLTAGTSGKQSYIIFVVRDDARPSNYLFQTSVNTYQAYNNWGGKSLYPSGSTNNVRARKVSFNRPYGNDGAGDFLRAWEYNLVRFLEREGYDVTYGTNVDVHENPNHLFSHKAFLSVGHDEYWSWQMRSNVVAARDQGVNLGFFSANTCYWQVRFEPSPITGAPDRTMVCYKDYDAYGVTEDPYYLDNDPSNDYLVTLRWRQSPVNLPEDALIGVMYENDPVDADLVVADATNWVFATTGLQNGDHLAGLLGYEVDRLFDDAPVGIELICHSPYTYDGSTFYSDMTVYTTASGATVFATGSIQWAWGLDDYNVPELRTSRLNAAAQQMTRNILARFISDQPPLAKPGGPYSGTATQPVQFDGGGSSDPDGVVTAYEWDFGDGTTRTGPTPTHAYNTGGSYTVTLIVTDDKGSRNAASTTAAIADFTLSASPASQTALQGSSATYTITVNPSGGFSQVVNFSIAGLPSGASYSFNPTAVAGSGASTLAVTTQMTTPSGTYTLTVSGTDGSLTHAATLKLTVAGTFTLSATPRSQTIVRSNSTSYTVTVYGGTGYNRTVAFSVSGLPKRTTATFMPTTVTASGTSVMTVSTSRSSAPKTYTLMITGSDGAVTHATSVTLILR